MGKSDAQTDHGHRHRNENQSPQPDGQTPRGHSDRVDKPAAGDAKPTDKQDAGDSTDSGWGLSKPKFGMTRETKVGLLLVLILTCAFALVVYKRIQKKNELLADAGEDETPTAEIHADAVRPTSVRGRRRFKQPRKLPNDQIFQTQHEPKEDDKPIDWSEGDRSSRRGSRRKRRFDKGDNPFGGGDHKTHGGGDHTARSGGDKWNLSGTSHTAARHPVTFKHEKGDVWDLDFSDFQDQPTGQVSLQPDNTSGSSGDPFGVQQSQQPSNTGEVSVGAFPQKSDDSQNGGGGSPFAKVRTQDNHSNAQNEQEHSQPKPLFGPDFAGGSSHSKSTADHSHDGHRHSEFDGGRNRFRNRAKSSDGFKRRERNEFSRREHQPNHQHSHPLNQGGDGFGKVAVDSTGSGTRVRKTSGTDESTEYPFGKASDFKDTPRRDRGSGPIRKKRYEQNRHFNDGGFEQKSTHHGSGGFSGDRPRRGDGLKVYTVANGDNYWSISRKAYGSARYFRALDAYNRYRISHPKRMRPGMKVLVPKLSVLVERYPQFCPGHRGGGRLAAERPSGFFLDQTGRPMYRVGKSDTLGGIAQKHLGRASRWIQIYRLNEGRIKNAKQLTIGTELRLPRDASRISVAPGRGVVRH